MNVNWTLNDRINVIEQILNSELNSAKRNKDCFHSNNIEHNYAYNYLKTVNEAINIYEVLKKSFDKNVLINVFVQRLQTQHDTKELEMLRMNDINKGMRTGITETYFNILDRVKRSGVV